MFINALKIYQLHFYPIPICGPSLIVKTLPYAFAHSMSFKWGVSPIANKYSRHKSVFTSKDRLSFL